MSLVPFLRFLLAACLFLLPLNLSAQDTRGMIFGRVLDSQAAPVMRAVVVVTNTGTNVAATLQTNETGYYEANLLVAGAYEVTAEAQGFKKAVRRGIVLNVSQRVPIDFTLELGSVSETLTVTEDAPLIETNSVSAGRVVDNRSLNELPVARNNPVLLAAFTPGVQIRGGYRTTAHRSASIVTTVLFTPGNVGGRSFTDSSNDYLMDGMPNVGFNRRIAFMPHTDAIQEFKVETSNLDPSVGFSSGISLSLMTKAGTNDLHGVTTWQHMQQRWNATPFFIKQAYFRSIAQAVAAGNSSRADDLRGQNPQAPGRTNDYSFSISGPVVIPKVVNGRNRLFFFFNYNGTKERLTETTSNINVTVPTLLNRAGNFSDLLAVDSTRYQIYDPLTVARDPSRPSNYIRQPFAGNIVPSSRFINPMQQRYDSLLPTPNNNPTNSRQEPLNNYIATAMPWQFNFVALSSRIDYQWSEKHRFFGRWNYHNYKEDRSDWTYTTLPGLHSADLERGTRAAMVDWVFTPTAATFFDVAVSINQSKEGQAGVVPKQFTAVDAGLPAYLASKAGGEGHLPIVNPAGYRTISRGFTTIGKSTLWGTRISASHVRGSHTIRGGFDMRQYFRTGGGGGATSGTFTFNNLFTRRNDDTLTPAGDIGHSWASFLLGLPSVLQAETNDSFAVQTPAFAWHVQDTWRLSPRLTLMLGMRFEYEGGLTERYNRALADFDPTLTLPISAAAKAAYAANPVTELAAANFNVAGGTVYAGQTPGGRNIWQGELMYLPRIGAAYQLNARTVFRAGYGIFYDSLNASYLTPNQFGFSRVTSTNLTNDFGATWLTGNPAAGVSPLRDPFPVRADGTRFDAPVRDALGGMAFAGRAFAYTSYGMRRARNQRWRVGVQRQLSSKDLIEAAYVGSFADRVYVARNNNPLPQQFWATGMVRNDAITTSMNQNVTNPFRLANFASLATSAPAIYQQMSTLSFFTAATIQKNQLLRPFPQMAGVTDSFSPVGNVWAHSLELTYTRRFSRGINFNAGYTRLKADTADIFVNEFDTSPTRRPSAYGSPHRFTATTVVDLPFGKGRPFLSHGWLSKLAGGFQVGITYEYQTGLPVDFPNLFYYGANLDDIANGPHTIGQWFNTDNFERAAARAPGAYHARVFPTRLNSVRGPSMNDWNANAQREFAFTERFRLQLRFDALNIMNHTIFSQPDSNPVLGTFGSITSTTEAPNRYMQFQARLRF
ncbi:MAG: carboxypeptidase regulatory-like domain-containing protein [Bryobacterales bacterium]|nr:carboxypeptidase regulatory-like domain-containing protein [Bryobacterales bacterium]